MSREKILVVDDEKIVRDTFTMVFNEYRIVEASNGKEALDILRRPNDIDLIVLDVVMPDISGVELLKEIKKMDPNHKVIILTGYGNKELVIEALRSDADEYLEKPFDISIVKEIFERLLSERRSEQLSLSGSDDKIGLAKRFIERNYDRVDLSLRDVAENIYLSPAYLSRIFKQKTGKTFVEYKMGLRVKAAKRFLEKCNCTVTQIAYMVGYQNPDSFMKMFKKITGQRPSQYRKKNKQKNRIKMDRIKI